MTTTARETRTPDVPPTEYKLFIGGEWIAASTGKTMDSVNPYTGQVWARVPAADATDVARAVASAREAFDNGPWGRMTGKDRGRHLRRLADLLRRDAEALARVEVTDTGKLYREMIGQLGIIPDWFDYFAGAADKVQGDTIPTDKTNFLVYTLREPIGVVGAITPWNSPLLLTTFKLAPALAAGCTFVHKPASATPCSALELAKLFEEADFPRGVYNVVTGSGTTVGAALAGHRGVDKVAFTGSTAAGIQVAHAAADHVAPVSLELGGKSPNIVFADADLEAAINGAVAGIFAAAGQTCLAGSRLLVERPVFDEFLERFAARARTIRLGDPQEPATEMGPVAFEDQLDKVLGYIRMAEDDGARVVSGGRRPTDENLRDGFFVEPTILAGISNSARIAQEEVFGPVACVIPFETEEEAITLGNDVPFGLAAGVWTRDLGRAHRMASRLRVGSVWLNAYRTLTYSVPFGGYKLSGYGRENGLDALREYTQTKSVWVELSGATRDPFKLG